MTSAAAPSVARARRVGFSPRLALALLGGAAGIGLRVWVYGAALGAPDSDEAKIGLMARHALHGQVTTFLWAQAYGGTQEVLLAVPVFAVFGSGLLQLRLVSMSLTALAAVLVWRVGRRTIGELEAVVAGVLVWIWPPFLLVHLTREYGFYASGLVYCALLLLLGLRIVEEPTRGRIGWFGLALGLAFWQTPQIIPIAVPVVGWILWKRPTALRRSWIAALTAVVGALPWLVWNARHGWASVLARSTIQGYEHGLRLFASPLLPMTIGLRAPLTGQALVPTTLMYGIYVLLLGLFAYFGWRRRRTNRSLLYLVAVAFPLLASVDAKFIYYTSAPRYVLLLTPVLSLLLAQLATRPAYAAALVATCCVVCAVSLHRMDFWYRTHRPQWPVPTPRSLEPLIATLARLHLRHVYAGYSIAYRLEFDTRQGVTVSDISDGTPSLLAGRVRPPPRRVGYPPDQRAVDAAQRYGFVVFRDSDFTKADRARLLKHGFSPLDVGPFVVWHPSERVLRAGG
jgi:4-amino-4-deoxy-L-arabinose transferase-like glycosyltransferase